MKNRRWSIILCLVEPNPQSIVAKGLFSHFTHVWVQDSSSIALPNRFAKSFPGSANQSGKK
ncbi:MAG: hypothetical protein HY360_06535 [Verrucomicrobia bacterium]|nr:hypothetical protein [Verrucomicrobiota bacterium]